MSKLVEVIWKDAVLQSDIPLKDIESNQAEKWLIKRSSFGKLIKSDSSGVILLHDIDEHNLCEFTVIPKEWLIEIKGEEE